MMDDGSASLIDDGERQKPLTFSASRETFILLISEKFITRVLDKATRVRLMMDDGSASLMDDGKGQKPLIQSATRQLLIQLFPKISYKLRL